MTEDDEQLRQALLRFRTDAASSGDGRVQLAVRVDRGRHLTHNVTTASGQTLRIDEPTDFGGAGATPDPAEVLLGAIGASISVTLTAYAAMREVSFDSVGVALTASIDGRDFFQPGSGEPGLLDIRVSLDVQTSAPRHVVDELMVDVVRTAPVLATLKTRPSVDLEYRRTALPGSLEQG